MYLYFKCNFIATVFMGNNAVYIAGFIFPNKGQSDKAYESMKLNWKHSFGRLMYFNVHKMCNVQFSILFACVISLFSQKYKKKKKRQKYQPQFNLVFHKILETSSFHFVLFNSVVSLSSSLSLVLFGSIYFYVALYTCL